MKKFNLFKKSVAITLAISLSTSSIIYAEDFSESSHSNFTSSSAVAVSEVSTIDSAINKSLSYYDSTSKNVLTNYADTLAILSSNGTLDGYTLPDVSTLTLDEYTKVSSLSSRIILLNTIGQNPRNTLNNRNLVSELLTEKDSSGKFGSYINSHIYAMIALYTSSEPFDVEEAINVLNDYYKGTTNYYGGTKLAKSF